jgi:hypothetical protein
MKNIFRKIPSCTLVLLLLVFDGQAQNNLEAGSIAFTSYQSDKDSTNTDYGGATAFTDRFSIVVLNERGLAANTAIYFTDNGWNASTDSFVSGTSEGFIKWVVPAGGVTFGTQIYFISKYIHPVMSWGAYTSEAGTTTAGTVTTESGSNYMELSSGGDQILAFQTGPAAGPAGTYSNDTRRFLTAIHANYEPGNTWYTWDTIPVGGHQSSIPPGLSAGSQTYWLFSYSPLLEVDNGKFKSAAVVDGCQRYLSSIVYEDASWIVQDSAFAPGATADDNSYSLIPKPSFITNPFDVTSCQGMPITFKATLDPSSDLFYPGIPGYLNYQWQQSADAAFTRPTNLADNSLYSGTTSKTLNIVNNGTLGGQYFRLVATNYCGATASTGALNAITPITIPPASTSSTLVNPNNYGYMNNNCEIIARVIPSGSSPVTGYVTCKVWVENPIPTYAGQPFVARHYEIMPANNAAAATGKVTLYFNNAEFAAFNAAPNSLLKLPTAQNDVNKANLRIAKYTGSSNDGSGLPRSYTSGVTILDASNVGASYNASVDRWLLTFDVTGFGGFIVQTSADALPVNLLAFTGRLVNDDAHLHWETTSETNNDYFDIERSLDGQTFTPIGRVAGNNGTTTQTYNWIDAGATRLPSTKLYYRLKIVSTTGEVEHSNIVTLSINTAGSPVVTVTPNPFTSQVNIRLELPAAVRLTLTLSDITGKKLKGESISAQKGNSTISFTGLGRLTQGIYLLAVQYNGQTYTYKLIK